MTSRIPRLLYPLTLAVALVSAAQSVDAVTIGAHLHTFHIGSQNDVPPALRNTDRTPGLYIRADSGLTAGIVRNSLRRTSVYLGQTWSTDDGRWSLTVGAISGYQYRLVRGQRACFEGFTHFPTAPCEFSHGKTSAVLRPLIAPSVALPAIGGVTPRVVLLGKGINVSVEVPL